MRTPEVFTVNIALVAPAGTVTLDAHMLFGLSYATEEILMDSPTSFSALLAAGFSDQFTYHIVDERLNGTGVGEFMGILTSPCLVSVSKETGLLKAWPKDGPKLLWTFKNTGEGFSSFAVVGNTLYTLGSRGSDEIVLALRVMHALQLHPQLLEHGARRGRALLLLLKRVRAQHAE